MQGGASSGGIMLELFGRRLSSPLFIPSGIVGVDELLAGQLGLEDFGFVVLKTITLKPRTGNQGVRVYDIPCGMMNSIGLANEGMDVFMKETLPRLEGLPIPYMVSISVHSVDELQGFNRLAGLDLWAIELNLSCPNVRHNSRGLVAQDGDLIFKIIKAARRLFNCHIVAKLSPDVAFIDEYAKLVASAGADGVAVANTFQGVAIDVKSRRPVFDRVVAGVSGPAIFHLALKRVWDVYRTVSLPILGIGGVYCADAALAMAMAGARVVGIGSFLYHRRDGARAILAEVVKYLEDNGLSWDELVGVAHGVIRDKQA